MLGEDDEEDEYGGDDVELVRSSACLNTNLIELSTTG
jgi:hypothetical protein